MEDVLPYPGKGNGRPRHRERAKGKSMKLKGGVNKREGNVSRYFRHCRSDLTYKVYTVVL